MNNKEGVNNKKDRWSEHGLGHLLNPTDPESEDRGWIAQAWLAIIRRALGLSTETLGFEHLPAVGQVTVSSPAVMRPLEKLNKGKRYPDQIKPFNFLLTCHVRRLGQPIGADPERFHLIAPYESDPKQWLKMDWIDQYTGKRYRITTSGDHGSRQTARVKTYGDILREYEFHPESKCADSDGKPCNKQTIGLLQRRHVRIDQMTLRPCFSEAEAGWRLRRWTDALREELGTPDFQWVGVPELGRTLANLHFHVLVAGLREWHAAERLHWMRWWWKFAGDALIDVYRPGIGGVRYILKNVGPDDTDSIEFHLATGTQLQSEFGAK